MTQNQKNSGMTSAQMGILLGLGALACILFGVIAWFLFGGNIQLPSFSRVSESTPTPQLTPTPFVLPTLTPTATLTPIPYEQLIPNGWKQFKTELIEIWLPEGFKPTDPKEFKEISQSGSAIPELILISTISDPALYRIVMGVSYEPLTTDSLESFLDQELPKVPPDVVVTERRKTSLNSQEVFKITVEARINNIDSVTLYYVFLDGGTVWYVQYGAQINDYYQMLPLFEQSAKTFRIVR